MPGSPAPPPLQGFNNNVKHRGHIFHIQTEDSGVKYPHVVTHLFADGGRIVKSQRTDYAEHVGRADMSQVLRRLMKEQHKAMFIALRAGQFDHLISDLAGDDGGNSESESKIQKAAPAAATPAVETAQDAAPASRARAPSLHPGQEIDFDSIERAAAEAASRISRDDAPAPPRAAGESDASTHTPTPALGSPLTASPRTRSGRYVAARPAAIFDAKPAPDSRSIFGGDAISEKSLDEVILSYLAEDLDAPPPEPGTK